MGQVVTDSLPDEAFSALGLQQGEPVDARPHPLMLSRLMTGHQDRLASIRLVQRGIVHHQSTPRVGQREPPLASRFANSAVYALADAYTPRASAPSVYRRISEHYTLCNTNFWVTNRSEVGFRARYEP